LGGFLEQKSFQLNNITQSILEECKAYAREFPEEECCGIIINKDNKLHFNKCDNIHTDRKNFFAINSEELIYNDVQYIFHTHWNGPARPSSFDKKSADELCLPFLIYSLIDDEFFLYENISV
jgi:proteasome lid subunit RPN8/RPN11